MTDDPLFELDQGVLVPRRRPHHRDDEYDDLSFEILLRMQRKHFWYRGRHRLLLRALERALPLYGSQASELSCIDLGGGCGGWLEYLHDHAPALFSQLALGDSSMRALVLAESVVSSFAARYQIDLLDLPWVADWDVVFLLDVLEHIPDHQAALRQIHKSIRPGGLLVLTAPALRFFWTYNDEFAQHQRRYAKSDLEFLAQTTGFQLLRADYFMFFLSPALFLARTLFRPPALTTAEQRRHYLARTHRVPSRAINRLLEALFSCEARLFNSIRFPWGTSILGVLQR